MKRKIMRDHSKKILKIILAAAVAAGVILLCIFLIPYILRLRDEAFREAFSEKIRSLGILGWGLMLLLQILQTVVAIIPGEPVEIVMGVMYGSLGGLLICLAGIALGTVLVFCCVNRFGMRFVNRFINSESFDKLKFLHDPARRDALMFILFFIPGTPKDILTYFAPFTKIPLLRFLVISLIARIPSVISSTYAGDAILEGNFAGSIIIFAVMGAIGIAGIFIYDRIIKAHNKK
ncbi:MAG: TVP38/TMEM64 family protein [Clostridia bacterium]|nr:TVP38/TMEM64 family protein [Clostridia bacterium]